MSPDNHIDTKRYPSKPLLWLGCIATFGMFLINFVGFLDTQSNSAEGCGPDWPLCNGKVLPALDNTHVIIEFLHRFLVGLFAIIAVVFAIWAWNRFGRWLEVKIFASITIGFIVIQSVLGALAVVFVNPPEVLALHMGFGLLGLVGTALLTVFLFQYKSYLTSRPNGLENRNEPLSSGLRNLMRWTWVYAFVAVYIGSYVGFRDAGTACSGWPLCNGQWFPGFTGNIGLVFAHRLIAVGLAVLVTVLLVRLMRLKHARHDLYVGTAYLLILVLLQIASGAYVILSNLNINADLLHVSILMVLFTLLSYLVLQSFRFHDTR